MPDPESSDRRERGGEPTEPSHLDPASVSLYGPAGAHSPVVSAAQQKAAMPPQIPDHELLRCIGRGSYGEVWLARNIFGEYRAVKILRRRDFTEDRPFEREFEGIRRFEPVSRSHPSQLAVLHAGKDEGAGSFYYVMELADSAGDEWRVTSDELKTSRAPQTGSGELVTRHSSLITAYVPRTLRHELKSRGRLPATECLDIGLALTTALAHLHQNGLVHRDIKPSNILFVGGVPKLGDIGLVTNVGDAQSIVGTEGYLPPEGPGTPQADIYSLGRVLYEISTGMDRREFPKLPEDLRQLGDAKLVLELNEILLRACAKDPAQRYRSAEAIHADLLRLQRGGSVRRQRSLEYAARFARRAALVAVGLALLALVLPKLLTGRTPEGTAVPEKASVFVLPFRSEGTNEVSVDLGRVTDAFIDSLALIEGVRRSPRKSGWRNFDEDELRHALAKTNNMRQVLTGRIANNNDTLSLTLRLYPRRSDQPLWTESFSGKTNELIELERRALRELTARVRLSISPNEQQRIGILLTNNLEALHWYQQAQAVYARKAGTQTGYTEVQKLAQRAVDLDGRYLDAEFLDAYMVRCLDQDRAPSAVWPILQRLMLGLLGQDDTYAPALDQMGGIELFLRRDWEAGYVFWSRGLLYQPERERHFFRAFYARMHGWKTEARVEQERFEQPEPTDCDRRFFMASSRWVERRYTEGVQVAQRTLELYPGHAEGYFWLAHCLVANSNYLEGIEATVKAQEVWKKQEMTALRAVAYAKMGQPEKAREALQELQEVQRTGPYLQPYFVARVYAALNDKDKALEYLEKAEQDSSSYLIFGDEGGGLRTDPAWDNLKDEPRFKELLRKVGLDQWPRPKPKDWSP
jgi:tetratricopeptide (TPR) repeat protein